ncbi:MAG: hypothetical protein QOE79_1069 [Sphingomonadales bacterium]|nr:hypothetical protein [Sphingomonadales bacterium]
MALLHDIQAELLDAKAPIGPMLLKLRYLAAKLGSDVLEEWVKYETEGYPDNVEVPEYRLAAVTYRGTFTNGFQTITNVSIPEFIIEKEAGRNWLRFSIRDSIAVIDSLLAAERPESGGKYGVAAGNLTPFLHNKVYEGMGAIEISSTFAGAPFRQIHNMVRAKILDLTLELEKRVPVAALIELGTRSEHTPEAGVQATTIAQTIIYGNQTNVSNVAPGGTIHANVVIGDQRSLAQFLIDKGLPAEDAQELARIASEEQPEAADKPIGKSAKKWLSKAIGTVWDVSKETGTQLLVEGLKAYYGLGT